LLTKHDKFGAAVIGGAIATLIAWQYPMPMEVQAAVTTLCAAGLAWFVPNKET